MERLCTKCEAVSHPTASGDCEKCGAPNMIPFDSPAAQQIFARHVAAGIQVPSGARPNDGERLMGRISAAWRGDNLPAPKERAPSRLPESTKILGILVLGAAFVALISWCMIPGPRSRVATPTPAPTPPSPHQIDPPTRVAQLAFNGPIWTIGRMLSKPPPVSPPVQKITPDVPPERPRRSGPNCHKGCPCGRSCIDCSKRCHK